MHVQPQMNMPDVHAAPMYANSPHHVTLPGPCLVCRKYHSNFGSGNDLEMNQTKSLFTFKIFLCLVFVLFSKENEMYLRVTAAGTVCCLNS